MEAEERDWNQQKMTGMAKEKTSKKKYTVQRKVVRNTVDFLKIILDSHFTTEQHTFQIYLIIKWENQFLLKVCCI